MQKQEELPEQNPLLGDVEDPRPYQTFSPVSRSPVIIPEATALDKSWLTLHAFAGASGSALFPIFALAAYALIPSVALASAMAGGAGAWGLLSIFVKWWASDKPFNSTALELAQQLNALEAFLMAQNDMLQEAVGHLERLSSSSDKAAVARDHAENIIRKLSAQKTVEIDQTLFEKIIQEEALRVRDKIEAGVDAVNGFLISVLIPGFWLLTANGFLHPASNPDDPHTQIARKGWFDMLSLSLGTAFGGMGAAMSFRSTWQQVKARAAAMTGFEEQLNQIEAHFVHSEELFDRAQHFASLIPSAPSSSSADASSFLDVQAARQEERTKISDVRVSFYGRRGEEAPKINASNKQNFLPSSS